MEGTINIIRDKDLQDKMFDCFWILCPKVQINDTFQPISPISCPISDSSTLLSFYPVFEPDGSDED